MSPAAPRPAPCCACTPLCPSHPISTLFWRPGWPPCPPKKYPARAVRAIPLRGDPTAGSARGTRPLSGVVWTSLASFGASTTIDEVDPKKPRFNARGRGPGPLQVSPPPLTRVFQASYACPVRLEPAHAPPRRRRRARGARAHMGHFWLVRAPKRCGCDPFLTLSDPRVRPACTGTSARAPRSEETHRGHAGAAARPLGGLGTRPPPSSARTAVRRGPEGRPRRGGGATHRPQEVRGPPPPTPGHGRCAGTARRDVGRSRGDAMRAWQWGLWCPAVD